MSDIKLLEKIKNYDKDWCYQYQKRLDTLQEDMNKKSEKIKFPSKHKYAFVLGKNKKETRELRKEFEERNKTYEYPKERGK